MGIKTKKIILVIGVAVIFSIPFWVSSIDDPGSKMKGKILLQTEKNGEAWYVIPERGERVFLARPADALRVMKKYGLGVTHRDLLNFKRSGFPKSLAGKIVLDVEDDGKAYYISPTDLEEYYLGRPADAFQVMREQGLGVTDEYLTKIPEVKSENGGSDKDKAADEQVEPTGSDKGRYIWEYKGKEFSVKLDLFDSIYDYYQNRSKVITYTVGEEPANKTEEYLKHYLETDQADGAFSELASKIELKADAAGLNEDETVELASSFVQSIPYDNELAADILNNIEDAYMKYPYEVLYEKSGTCGGKSFLAVLLFDRLGYGTALFEFEEDDHLAPAVRCSKEHSTYSSGYCYVESTIEGYPIGIMPENNPTNPDDPEKIEVDKNTAGVTQDISGLRRGEIHRRTKGKVYTGIESNIERFQYIKELEKEINDRKESLKRKRTVLNDLKNEAESLKDQLNEYQENGENEKYNNLVPFYNNKVKEIKEKTAEYNRMIAEYNLKTDEYNTLSAELYQY